MRSQVDSQSETVRRGCAHIRVQLEHTQDQQFFCNAVQPKTHINRFIAPYNLGYKYQRRKTLRSYFVHVEPNFRGHVDNVFYLLFVCISRHELFLFSNFQKNCRIK